MSEPCQHPELYTKLSPDKTMRKYWCPSCLKALVIHPYEYADLDKAQENLVILVEQTFGKTWADRAKEGWL